MHPLPQRLQRTSVGRLLSQVPTLVVPYYGFSAALLDALAHDPRLRELNILRVAHPAEIRRPAR
jgi:hypothetical protein